MKKSIYSFILILLFLIFFAITHSSGNFGIVVKIYSATSYLVDLTSGKKNLPQETICLADVESFPEIPDNNLVSKFSSKYKLTKGDLVILGYLAKEFTNKSLMGGTIKVDFNGESNDKCKFANIKLDRQDFKTLLINNGFGIVNNEIINFDITKTKLDQAKKNNNLVIYNEHSHKYHTLDCPYGYLARNKYVISKEALSKDAIPCHYCHKINKRLSKRKLKNANIKSVSNTVQPPLKFSEGSLSFYLTDFTKNLKPNNRCETEVCRVFVSLIDNTSSTLDMALYGYDEIPAITKALERAKARGVNIRYVYDESYNQEKTFYKNNSTIVNLSTKSRSDRVTSQSLSDIIMHNKFIIFDNKTIFTGSLNISPTGMSGYDVNDTIIIKSEDIAKLYEEEFEQMLKGVFHKYKKASNLAHSYNLGNSIIEVYFLPQDKPISRILEIIKNAKSYIYMPTFLLTHNMIAQELINAHQRGVDVKLITDANNTSLKVSKIKELRANKIPVKIENYAGKMHIKSIIVDDEYLITGSMNFSSSGEKRNDENVLIIKNTNIAKTHKNFFNYLWKVIPDKFLKFNPSAEGPYSIGSCTDGVDNNFDGKIDQADSHCIKK